MTETIFRDTPITTIRALSVPLAKLIDSHSDFKTEIGDPGNPEVIVKNLAEGRLQFAVLTGVEYGKAKKKYPTLQPLMILVNETPYLSACLITKKKTGEVVHPFPAQSWCVIPEQSRYQCYLFLEKHKHSFDKIIMCDNVEKVLDDMVDGVYDAAIVDSFGWKRYQANKPMRANRLIVKAESIRYPSSTVLYMTDKVTKDTAERLKQAIFAAQKGAIGRFLILIWRMTGFVEIPADYEEQVKRAS